MSTRSKSPLLYNNQRLPDKSVSYNSCSNLTLKEDEDYDPHQHRNVQKSTNYLESLIHLVKSALGTGLLAMPQAFQNAGLINGLISMFLIAVLWTYCIHILMRAQYELCKRHRVPYQTYSESIRIAIEEGPMTLRKFASSFSVAADVFLIIFNVGACCIYFLFVSLNLQKIVNNSTGKDLHLIYYMLALLIPFIMISLIRNLKYLAPVSSIGNVIIFVCIGIFSFYIFQDLPKLSEISYWGTIDTYPMFFGTAMFSLQSVGVIVAIEQNMKNPKRFGGCFGTFSVSMLISVTIYIAVGFGGYWKYGAKTAASVTLNLPNDQILSKSANILYCLSIYVSYGLEGYVPISMVWDGYLKKYHHNIKHPLLWEYVLRVAFVIFTFVLAASIPLLGLFISWVGAFSLSTVGFIFPPMMEICVFWPHIKKLSFTKNLVLIFIGVIGFITGSYCSIYKIMKTLTTGNS